MRAYNKIRIGLIGAGYWGKNIARVLHELGVLSAISDQDDNILAERKKEYPSIQITCNVKELLSDKTIKALAIATPAATHYELAKEALMAGKDVFVEKPLALKANDGENLVELARKGNRILMVGHLLHYHPTIIALKKLVTDNKLGKIQYISSHRLNFGKLRKEENVLWSFAPHDISIIISILGEPITQQSFGKSYINKGTPDITLSFLQFPNNTAAHVFVSWLHPVKEQRLCIIGEKGMAMFDDQAENKLLFYAHTISFDNQNTPCAVKAKAVPIKYLDEEPLSQEMAHFIDCIRTRQNPITDGEEGLRVLRVLQACQHSIDNNKNTFEKII